MYNFSLNIDFIGINLYTKNQVFEFNANFLKKYKFLLHRFLSFYIVRLIIVIIISLWNNFSKLQLILRKRDMI